MLYPRYDYDKNKNLIFLSNEGDEINLLIENQDVDYCNDVTFIGARLPNKRWRCVSHCLDSYFNKNIKEYMSYINKCKNSGLECRIFSSREMCWKLEEINNILSIEEYFNRLINETVEINFTEISDV